MRKRIFTMALLASLAAPAQAQAYKPDAGSGSWAPPGVSCDSDQSLFRMTERIMWKGVPAMGANFLQSDDPMEWLDDIGKVPLDGEQKGVFIQDNGETTYTFRPLGGDKAQLLSAGKTPIELTRCPGTQVDFSASDQVLRDISQHAAGPWYRIEGVADTANAGKCEARPALIDGNVVSLGGDIHFTAHDDAAFFDEKADMDVVIFTFGAAQEKDGYWRLDTANGQQYAVLTLEGATSKDEYGVLFQQRPMGGTAQPVMIMQDLSDGRRQDYARCGF